MPLTVTAELIREHLLYTAWASRRLVHAIEQLSPEQLNQDFKSSEHSILGTLGHVFAADRVWVSRVRGEEATALSASDIDLHVLQIDWPLIYAKWNE